MTTERQKSGPSGRQGFQVWRGVCTHPPCPNHRAPVTPDGHNTAAIGGVFVLAITPRGHRQPGGSHVTMTPASTTCGNQSCGSAIAAVTVLYWRVQRNL